MSHVKGTVKMNQKNFDQIPSQTALFTALRRALAHKEYHKEKFGPDNLAEIFLPSSYRFFLKFARVRENTKDKLAAAMPGMNEYIIARTAFFDGLFMDAIKDQIPQIVLLGAGYDSRAYRFAKHIRGTKIFELDALPTQDRKIKFLKAAKVSIPKEVNYVPINFLNESLSDVLEKAGYQNRDRTLFLWEGVSYYLDREAVKETLGFVSHSSNQDSMIAFDYAILLSEENNPEVYGAKEFMQSMKEHHAKEALLFSIKDGEIEAFLAEMNLRMSQYLDQEAIAERYLTDDQGKLIGKMAGSFRIVCASPVKVNENKRT
jgi:methyltransferase (TIGR00027 family)